eukprot:scaffold33567_cov79-Isochrysis_galbana.AAC.1
MNAFVPRGSAVRRAADSVLADRESIWRRLRPLKQQPAVRLVPHGQLLHLGWPVQIGQVLVREVVCRKALVAQWTVAFSRFGTAAGAAGFSGGVIGVTGGWAAEPDHVTRAQPLGAPQEKVEAELLGVG